MKRSNPLLAFDRLEIGPVKVERKRLSTPYRLFYNGTEDRIDLIYTYEEAVFDPADPAGHNLAAMVGAQVAFNYGLFCKKIVFRDAFDNADIRFIRDMMENTSREIYVKKFLEPNHYLIGEAAHLPMEKKPRYLEAELEFPAAVREKDRAHWDFWPTESRRHAILSSGGKDSLVSYGLLDEIGCETHPIYINESGRHWFTALNAYNYFKENVPNTARVWTNSDRVFNWMLRHLPFIRPDYANIRSDEYAVRLWTVAVFSFGALPLMRKRGIGRLLIGDEFDTTRRANHNGITHYDGLYDQSSYFDNALSRYYLRKGWNISQFSILRPLSDLLIQKLLVKRYPHLQQQQVSCHAAHKEDHRIHPCGQCEKCRRIVGMLKALDADPARCGYSEKQVQKSLENFTSTQLNQESACVRQLTFMLAGKKLVTIPSSVKKFAHGQPEVLKLRFDPERSPIHGIPLDLRTLLYGIYLEYADGALQRMDHHWKTIDPLTDISLHRPYAFEVAPADSPGTPRPAARWTVPPELIKRDIPKDLPGNVLMELTLNNER
jgi:hypothetical protein